MNVRELSNELAVMPPDAEVKFLPQRTVSVDDLEETFVFEEVVKVEAHETLRFGTVCVVELTS